VAIYAKKERNFMFSIGDKVVYPMHGAGIIESIEEREILGELKKYYVMKIPIGEMKVMIPINNVEGIGIRDVIDNKCADSVFKSLEIKSDEQTSNWNKRYRENMDKIKSGDVFEVADVVKHLVLRERNKGLSTGERKMLNSAKQILISELVLAKNMNPNDVEDIINTRITS
jgi:CarD family transcriptional regulator